MMNSREACVPEKKTKIQLPGIDGVVDAVEVPVTEATERWTEIHLSDGTVIRTKPVILSVMRIENHRIENHYDPEGNPMYQVKANQIMTADAPDRLRKGAPGSSKTH